MGRKWYGSINNRIEEGRNCEPDKIKKNQANCQKTIYFFIKMRYNIIIREVIRLWN